jgi:hypothetical protein
MKIAIHPGFWSLRPTLTVRGLELGCWLAAGVLAVALVISPPPPPEPPTSPVSSVAAPRPANLLAFRQHCIEGILGSDLGMTEKYVVRQINQQCSTRRYAAVRPLGPTCGRPFVGPLTPIARQVTACPGG